MFMWKVSRCSFSAGLPTALTSLRAWSQVLMKSVSKRLSGSMQICWPRSSAYLQIVLRFLTTVFHCSLVFGRRHRVGAAYRGIDRPDQRRAFEHDHLVNDLLHVVQAVLLLFGRAAQIAVRPEAGASRAADQAVLVQLALHVRRVDVGRVLDGNLDGVKAPLLELFEQFGAVVGKR